MRKPATKGKGTQTKKNGLVLTPGGWRSGSKVHHVGPGQHIDGQGGKLRIIETATGKVIEDLGETPEAEPGGPEKDRSGVGTPRKAKKRVKKK